MSAITLFSFKHSMYLVREALEAPDEDREASECFSKPVLFRMRTSWAIPFQLYIITQWQDSISIWLYRHCDSHASKVRNDVNIPSTRDTWKRNRMREITPSFQFYGNLDRLYFRLYHMPSGEDQASKISSSMIQKHHDRPCLRAARIHTDAVSYKVLATQLPTRVLVTRNILLHIDRIHANGRKNWNKSAF